MLRDLVTEELKGFFSKTLLDGYSMTHWIGEAYPLFKSEIGREQLPYIRRGAIDFLALKNVSSVPGLSAAVMPNKSGNCHHLELYFGDRLIISTNHLANINGKKQVVPRQAIFRSMLAAHNSTQIEIWPTRKEAKIIKRPILAILAHEGNSKPEAASLIITDSGCRRIIDHVPVDLTPRVSRSDVNEIQELVPEFIEFVRRQAK